MSLQPRHSSKATLVRLTLLNPSRRVSKEFLNLVVGQRRQLGSREGAIGTANIHLPVQVHAEGPRWFADGHEKLVQVLSVDGLVRGSCADYNQTVDGRVCGGQVGVLSRTSSESAGSILAPREGGEEKKRK